MPACTGDNCASQLADYIWVEFVGGTLTAEGGTRPVVTDPTQAEITARTAAGKSLYDGTTGSNTCFRCHGPNGNDGGFNDLTATALGYDEIISILENGEGGLMPACTGGNCASQLADYIWVEFLGKTLTADGGI